MLCDVIGITFTAQFIGVILPFSPPSLSVNPYMDLERWHSRTSDFM